MSILSKLFNRKSAKKVSVEELRLEEKKLEIRENQSINKIEKLDKERQELFNTGSKTKSPARRRIYARRFTELSKRISMFERDLSHTIKELMTVNRLRHIFEKEKAGPRGLKVLENMNEEKLSNLLSMLEDDKISEGTYVQKLDTLLGIANEPAYEVDAGIGDEGMEVLKTWEAMDDTIDSDYVAKNKEKSSDII